MQAQPRTLPPVGRAGDLEHDVHLPHISLPTPPPPLVPSVIDDDSCRCGGRISTRSQLISQLPVLPSPRHVSEIFGKRLRTPWVKSVSEPTAWRPGEYSAHPTLAETTARSVP